MDNISSYFLRTILLFVGLTVVVRLYAVNEPTSAGTGFVVNPDGYLLTCEHVVRDAGKIQVTLGAKTWDATVISVDKVHDLALIQIPVKGLIALPLANSNAIEVGQEARAFGFPLSSDLGKDIKVTRGTIGGISIQNEQKVIQIDTVVGAGNSGDPLVNEKGEVICVINAKLVPISVTNLGFAIPINNGKLLLQEKGIKFTEEGTKEKLDDATLVKQVSPSVALINVWKKIETTLVNPKDGAEMVLVPAGEFLMGGKEDDILAFSKEKPQHKVYLDTYYIYKKEVTVEQYRKFCLATGNEMPKAPRWGLIDNHPIVVVNWNEANAYAQWAGVKLPTEAQWEKAARGTDGPVYPWGNGWDITRCANWENSCNKQIWGTHPVGSFPTGDSPYGCLDMAGNVWEWCVDWYKTDYYATSSLKNPTGPEKGSTRVLRGGAWNYGGADGYLDFKRYDNIPEMRTQSIGFRCVSPAP